ncbi:MAG: glycosyl transferase [Cyclobacteriaceae bacterium]|nr:MAG: glycosyl transferase [Cyclobacteriaceae bacterium]
MSKSIIFIIPYPPGQAPSQRFRFEQYFPALTRHGYTVSVFPFLNPNQSSILYGQSNPLLKIAVTVTGLLRRCVHLWNARHASFVFIHREAAPVGPPVFEWILARVLRKKIIFDFDDAIWLTDKQETWLERFFRWRSKVKHICRWSYRISCGNAYLANWAGQFNASVVINPTTIDTENLHNPQIISLKKDPDKLFIGWTGSHSTLKYLEQLVPVLRQLEQEFQQVHFLVIANRNPGLPLQRCSFIPWQKESEAEDLARIDIGLMPLPDDEWTRGKCGFKALQYMAMQIPCIASPVGVNSEIIQHGVNGFLAHSPPEWKFYLTQLIADGNLRNQLGKAGRKTVINRYSVSSNTPLFLSLFDISHI